jgi:hypothetical protein
MTRAAALAALACAVVAAGCGGEAGDLIALEVSGGAEERPLEIVVSGDGRGSCNGSDLAELPSALVIDAREVEREIADLAEEGADFGRASGQRRGYVARTNAGTVRWREGATQDEVLGKAALLAVELERELC